MALLSLSIDVDDDHKEPVMSDDETQAEALLLAENISKHLKPTIRRLSEDVNSIFDPVTKGLRNELKEGIRRVDGISHDLKKQLAEFSKHNKQAEVNLGRVSMQLSSNIENLNSSVSTKLEELLKPVAHGLVNDVRQATENERRKLKSDLEETISQVESTIIKLEQDRNISFFKKMLPITFVVALSSFITITTTIAYNSFNDPISSLSAIDQRTFATGKMFEKVWPAMTAIQKEEYRILASEAD